jgi:GNAT superfamily N-acetyltransferase
VILTRPALPADRNFIVSGWSTSYRHSRDCTTPMSLYAKHKHEEIEFYLDRCSALVAHGELGVSMGFIAFDPSTYVATLPGQRRITLSGYVLYVYVAGPFRRHGVARALFAAAGISPGSRFGYACSTRMSWELRSKIPLAEREPYRARYEETEHVRRAEAAGAEGADADSGPQDLAP